MFPPPIVVREPAGGFGHHGPAGESWSTRLQIAPANQDLAARIAETFPGADRRLTLALEDAAAPFDSGPLLGGLFLAAHAAVL